MCEGLSWAAGASLPLDPTANCPPALPALAVVAAGWWGRGCYPTLQLDCGEQPHGQQWLRDTNGSHQLCSLGSWQAEPQVLPLLGLPGTAKPVLRHRGQMPDEHPTTAAGHEPTTNPSSTQASQGWLRGTCNHVLHRAMGHRRATKGDTPVSTGSPNVSLQGHTPGDFGDRPKRQELGQPQARFCRQLCLTLSLRLECTWHLHLCPGRAVPVAWLAPLAQSQEQRPASCCQHSALPSACCPPTTEPLPSQSCRHPRAAGAG